MSSSSQPQGLHRLTALAVKNIHEPGWHADGGGLYLEVDVSGRKRWAMRLTVNGRRRDFGLGPIHKVSLAQAREAAAQYRAKAYQGIDPIAERRARRATEAVPTFAEAAASVHAQHRATWTNGKHVDQWITTLETHAYPYIGARPINEITRPDILKVLSPIWTEKPETARRVKQRLATVFDWARVAGHYTGSNPVELVTDALPKHKKSEKHHAALPYIEVPEFIRKLRAGPSEPLSKIAFEFLILTATRTTEVRAARRSEISLAEKTWTIPGNDEGTGRRTKTGREHIVPLSDRCVALLTQALLITGESQLLFPDVVGSDRPMSENRFLVAREALGYDRDACTPHGFRSSFRDWAAEETDFPSEVVEMALAHTIRSKTEAAYRRGNLLAKRAELMAAWSVWACPR